MHYDIERINRTVDLIELADRYTTLQKVSAHELAGPCPRCGGDDRFHVHGDGWFFCRQCHERRGDAIEFVQWIGLTVDFHSACALLDAGLEATVPRRQLRRKEKNMNKGNYATWRTSAWQSSARRELEAAQDRLWNQPGGSAGREYLESRGLRPDTWLAWDLGYGSAWHPVKRVGLPAVWMPWMTADSRITAIQYRFIDSLNRQSGRFGQRTGGERILFGAQLRDAVTAEMLILVEGELNAVSLWQECYGRRRVDVLSWGPQDNICRPAVVQAVTAVAVGYRRVVVWADEPEHATRALEAMGATEALQSLNGQDANDLLQHGWLTKIVDDL